MKSDKSFKEFMKNGAPLLKILPIIILGASLLVFGFLFSEKPTEEKNEEDLSVVCSKIEGVGECNVTVTYGENGSVCGVAVMCEGADNPSVRARLVDFFSSLYGIGANRITVLKITDKN